ncbi:MAG: ABC transporter substrate-binding protein [Mycobacterium sp.]
MLLRRPPPGVLAACAAGAVAASVTISAGCSSEPATGPAAGSSTLITSTTKIAGAGVLGNQRRPDESCAAEPAPLDPGSPTRLVQHAAGATEVIEDPRRIVVLSGDQLDALCALGLQSRIVAAALPDGSDTQPSYLGTTVHDLPAVGTRSAPDLAAIAAAAPDLILGSDALTPAQFGPLSEIAPTVFTAAPGEGWTDNLRIVGTATGRAEPATALVDGFDDFATEVGVQTDATHFQASIVQLTDSTIRIYGPANFPGSVFTDVGVDRPAAQRFTDQPYLEIGASDADLAGNPDFSAADGDIVYVSFASPAAKDRAPTVLGSDAWRALSANRDNRVFIVNNEIWQTGQGIVAARGIIDDLSFLNAPIN